MVLTLETVARQQAHAARHSGAVPTSKDRESESAGCLGISDEWEIWVFHAVIPEAQAEELVQIPKEFAVVDWGEIPWKTSTSCGGEAHGPVHELLVRALDNLLDGVLLPLSIVRFGFRQWIALDGLALQRSGSRTEPGGDSGSAGFSAPAKARAASRWVLPLTPPSSDIEVVPDVAEFLAASAELDTKRS
ncbi:hypothetical protein H4R26_004721, partial [Coemansia thaxteri]